MPRQPLQPPAEHRFEKAWAVFALLAILAGLVGSPSPAAGQQAGPVAKAPSDIWHRDTMTGDWNGARTALADKGVTVSLTYTSDLQGNMLGGIRTGGVFNGVFQPEVDFDLEKLIAWHGASARVSALVASGPSLSADDVGNLLNTSGINARPAARLYNAWLQQDLWDDRLSLRLGLMTADAEFFVSPTAGLFINSSFGWPGILALDLPGGGPAYPLPAPGLRLRLQPTEAMSLSAGVFSGDPTGNDGSNSLSIQQPKGTEISFNGGVLMMVEAGYAANQGKDARGLPATFKIGGWYHTSPRFGDQRFDSAGRSLADPASSGMPALHDGDWGGYGIVDAMVYREPGSDDQGLSLFTRLSAAPGDRNLIATYVDAGMSYKGLFPGRDDDIAGIAVAYAPISNRARNLDRDARDFGGTDPVRSAEAVIEGTYQLAVTPWWSLQADLQYVVNPGGRIANDDGSPIDNALVIGLRTALTF